jgi:hypothetical protein
LFAARFEVSAPDEEAYRDLPAQYTIATEWYCDADLKVLLFWCRKWKQGELQLWLNSMNHFSNDSKWKWMMRKREWERRVQVCRHLRECYLYELWMCICWRRWLLWLCCIYI